jgi:aminopeptidase N
MRSRTAVLLTTAATLVGMTPAGAAAAAGPDDPVAGASGIGDPYYPLDGNGGYDVEKYDLDLRYDPATDQLSGSAVITARTTEALSSFNLDFEGMHIGGVSLDGRTAVWARVGGELTVVPQKPLADHRSFTVRVDYSGVPKTIHDDLGISGFMHTDDGLVVAGQPDGAATWFPANDHPRDAAAVEVRITVPEGLQGISNGELEGSSTHDGWTTWHWNAAEPMATYMVVLAVGHFRLHEYRDHGVDYVDALDPHLDTMPADESKPKGPSLGDNAKASLARQPEIIRFLADRFGPYPFDQAGAIVDDLTDLQFALETQTRPIYSPLFFTDREFGDIGVVHELAHQWLGDSVRLHDWRDIWLNEGAATYAEWLWTEHEGGPTTKQQFDQLLAVPKDDPFYKELWAGTPGDPGAAVGDLFGTPVYVRGAMTHEALRQAVGDHDYFRILRAWATSEAGKAVTTDDFIALAEKISGKQLDDLFKTGLYTPGRPASVG